MNELDNAIYAAKARADATEVSGREVPDYDTLKSILAEMPKTWYPQFRVEKPSVGFLPPMVLVKLDNGEECFANKEDRSVSRRLSK